ncbi:hypothetical protein G4V62_15125 [Bacillaceae bacterium SIJ1]|uniref:DUF2268 domain-containing protein n=1 Tax=Litoribacterium kuwaitense TaxID=1398745 RepID=UPI0013EA3476|nr:DUF2268 domain-containing putative Zn-dependent protease [Litoribacterium kuwaitense]NGP46219.1 hypothetical protein [Litoribacterium kuwaitense]
MQKSYEVLDTVSQYHALLELQDERKREDYFRYTMMEPLADMWKVMQVPMKAKEAHGYDVLMATKMLGFADLADVKQVTKGIDHFQKHHILKTTEETIAYCLERANRAGLKVNAKRIQVGMYVADGEELKHSMGYTGFGGIPGFIMVMIDPNDYNIRRIPSILTHEFHHNLRFSYVQWHHGDVTVGDYLVIEGLAEAFAAELYGEEWLGPWVTRMDEEDLAYSVDVIGDALDVKGFADVSSYMFGDEIAEKRGYTPVGLPFCAGYAVGYYVVRSFLNRTNKSIYESTLLSSEEIIRGSGVFAGGWS